MLTTDSFSLALDVIWLLKSRFVRGNDQSGKLAGAMTSELSMLAREVEDLVGHTVDQPRPW